MQEKLREAACTLKELGSDTATMMASINRENVKKKDQEVEDVGAGNGEGKGAEEVGAGEDEVAEDVGARKGEGKGRAGQILKLGDL